MRRFGRVGGLWLVVWLMGCQTAVGLPVTPSPSTAVFATPTLPPPVAITLENVSEPVLGFDGERAFGYLEAQMAIGDDRWPGSEGHWQTGAYIMGELERLGWEVEEQRFEYLGVGLRNVVGKGNIGRGSVIIVGAHYDTRRVADETPGAAEQGLPVPGAVDGASGVAVLLELAEVLDLDDVPHEIWLTFFDGEDNGNGGLPGWDWIVGSQYMADQLAITPTAMVLVDLVGDADQQLYYEGHSDPALRERLWKIAAELGHGEAFISEQRYTMIDDHVPFMRRGIPSVDIIDFDYSYWHTVEDTADKASPTSLWRVGQTIEYWLEQDLE